MSEKDVWYLPTYQFRDDDGLIVAEGSDWAEAKREAKREGFIVSRLNKTVSAALVTEDGNDYDFRVAPTEREAKARLKKRCPEFDFKLIQNWFDKE